MQTFLALGDSYTIGELVPLHESFPYQVLQLLRDGNLEFSAPEIVAKTGWTTDELLNHINSIKLNIQYDIVTLLIGVNNQYRGRSVENFIPELNKLIEIAINKSGNKNENVFLLSIPDWGVTPFAKEKDQQKISLEIDQYNNACKNSAANFGLQFIDITASQRLDNNKDGFLAEDNLHPSGKEYKKWAEVLVKRISGPFNN